MKVYVVLDVGCLECDEVTEIVFLSEYAVPAYAYYNNHVTKKLEYGETNESGRIQFHEYDLTNDRNMV